MIKFLLEEEFISVQAAQMGIARACQKAEKKKSFLRVMKNNQPVGVLIPDKYWLKLLEDFETIFESYRKELAVSAPKAKKQLGEQLNMIDFLDQSS